MILRTLHSYILRELFKVFVAATLVLTLVLSLGGLLQPLRHHGVSAVQLFQLILYLFPMMLTFSLPLSALLAASLAYGRLSADNELIACRASGISLHMLMVPAVGLGLLVMVSNLLMSNWVIPGCKEAVEGVVERNIQEIAYNKLKNDRQLQYEDWVISAEEVEIKDEGGPPKIMLTAPSMIELKQGRPLQQILCDYAVLQFSTDTKGKAAVTVIPLNAMRVPWDNVEEPVRVHHLTMRWEIPPIVKDDVSFKSYGELKELLADPTGYYKVQKWVEEARDTTAHKILYRTIIDKLTRRPDAEAGAEGDRSYRMVYEIFGPDGTVENGEAVIEADHAAQLKEDQGLQLGGGGTSGRNVRITLLGEDGKPTIRYEARQAILKAISHEDSAAPMVDVQFPGEFSRYNLRVGTVPAIKRNGQMIERLLPPRDLTQRVENLPPSSLEPDQQQQAQMERQKYKLFTEIKAELHSRGAFSVAGLLLVVLGTLLGIIFRSGHVLVAFGVSVVPAMIAIFMVIMGEKVATSSSSSLAEWGFMFIWMGDAMILAIIGAVYSRMVRR